MMIRSKFIHALMVSAVLVACGGGEEGDEPADEGKKATPITETKTMKYCGSEKCTLPDELKEMDREICCRDQFQGGCGYKSGASSCLPLPKIDERCPVPTLMINAPMGAQMSRPFGCCTGGNECGIDFGMGCQPRTIACDIVNASQVSQIKRETCDGEELPLPEGCGMNPIMIPRPGGAAGSGN